MKYIFGLLALGLVCLSSVLVVNINQSTPFRPIFRYNDFIQSNSIVKPEGEFVGWSYNQRYKLVKGNTRVIESGPMSYRVCDIYLISLHTRKIEDTLLSVLDFSLSPSGRWLILNQFGTLSPKLLDLDDLSVVDDFSGTHHQLPVDQYFLLGAWSPDERYFAWVYEPPATSILIVLDTHNYSWEQLEIRQNSNDLNLYVQDISFSKDGKSLFVTPYRYVYSERGLFSTQEENVVFDLKDGLGNDIYPTTSLY